MYNTDLYIEFTRPINLKLEKINFRFNDEVIGTAEINKNLSELEDLQNHILMKKQKKKLLERFIHYKRNF